MKGHKEHHHRAHHAKGGETGGVDEAKEDLDMKTHDRVDAPEIDREANERKRGGRAEEKPHHKECKCERCMGGRAKRKRGGKIHVGMVEGEHAKHRADRKPRKAGGRAEASPFSAARHGTAPKGRKLDMEME